MCGAPTTHFADRTPAIGFDGGGGGGGGGEICLENRRELYNIVYRYVIII